MALSGLPYGRGDIILVSNDPKPKNNNEQKGMRPCLVVSRRLLNKNGPFVWVVPFTTTEREYPLAFNWTLNCPDTTTKGTLLCDQIYALDVKHHWSKLLEHTEVPIQVDNIIQAILGYK
ncbi:MAG: type II toxin-antitoxin system PemK/MazF family toxin [Limosilactobacillus coleohominis]|uniref:type II toxin-antitoxin system PemK/MazF family toxin n=1 Tax=Limosilactobacillus coleohominis TaxID=181675 RepID=UPI002A83B7C3|nr:type II toxin-antitoxin system PemK/MazF family toxin [Limosilactobacillus coleohominis]MCI5812764.1 type II toxin-antitoxin system PemK/MazF family toxin [Lactobacillus sp.]MDY3702292.1 type II toxin-antitoxin system PemK/MazF family toxin [Limosilactobacillus coleohominis]MDY5629306.1 type II toxin-antitoxin system PemK/MazF family toxin [Limosilactobacillus coleohominis]